MCERSSRVGLEELQLVGAVTHDGRSTALISGSGHPLQQVDKIWQNSHQLNRSLQNLLFQEGF
jgi:hypothetical protein